MTKSDGDNPRKTDVKVSLMGGHRLAGATLHERTVTASVIGGVRLRVRPDVRVEVHGLRLGGVSDDGPSEPGGPAVRIDVWGLLGGVSVHRA